ncbi:hypothetical protein N2152v2_009306 [Parachlorella kessleri]
MEGAKAQRVLIAEGLDRQAGPPPSFVTLPDPRTGQPSSYLLAGNLLQEINWVKQQFSSWFVDDTVVQDGGLYVCTPVDPLFLALPLLERARGAQREGSAGLFCDMEQVLQGVRPHSVAQQLTSLLAPHQLAWVCDCKLAAGQHYYRLSDEKVLAWLQRKVDQTKASLLASPSSGASFASMESTGLTAYAAGLLGEYLSDGWAKRLQQALCLPEQTPQKATAAAGTAHHPASGPDSGAQRPEKRPKLDPKGSSTMQLDPKEAAKQKAAESRLASKNAKLAKEASSMRKLSSFFKPDPAAAAGPGAAK